MKPEEIYEGGTYYIAMHGARGYVTCLRRPDTSLSYEDGGRYEYVGGSHDLCPRDTSLIFLDKQHWRMCCSNDTPESLRESREFWEREMAERRARWAREDQPLPQCCPAHQRWQVGRSSPCPSPDDYRHNLPPRSR